MHPTHFEYQGAELPITFIETQEVRPGVHCDVYQFVGDTTRDLGIITIENGCVSPLQRVVEGTQTLEGFVSGKGVFELGLDGEIAVTQVAEGAEFESSVPVGATMQWKADRDSVLVYYEICTPPYEPGRFEELS